MDNKILSKMGNSDQRQGERWIEDQLDAIY